MQLLKPGAFRRYLYNRRKVGDNGVYGLEYAVYLSKLPIDGEDERATDARPPPRIVCEDGTLDGEWVNLSIGDCVPEMRKMPLKMVQRDHHVLSLLAGTALLRCR
jgi:hypothetical protein